MSERFDKNVIKRRFRKFSAQTYHKILKAWISPLDPLEDNAVTKKYDQKFSDWKLINGSSIGSNESLQLDDKPTPTETVTSEAKQMVKTIDLSDSFDSIPETPDFVEKRKQIKRQNNRKSKKRSVVNQFFDLESEVVIDSSQSLCDDIEDTQREMENSSQTVVDYVIPPDTQPIGQLINGIDSRNAEDMKTVYLRSIRSQMIGNSDKFKLQYNFDPNIDVFSQEPNESDLEDYEMDSFCVPNDSIEFMDTSPQTATHSIDMSMESPVLQIRAKDKKKFKRIIFSP